MSKFEGLKVPYCLIRAVFALLSSLIAGDASVMSDPFSAMFLLPASHWLLMILVGFSPLGSQSVCHP